MKNLESLLKRASNSKNSQQKFLALVSKYVKQNFQKKAKEKTTPDVAKERGITFNFRNNLYSEKLGDPEIILILIFKQKVIFF